MEKAKPCDNSTFTKLRSLIAQLRMRGLQDLGMEALRGAAYRAGAGFVTVLVFWTQSRR